MVRQVSAEAPGVGFGATEGGSGSGEGRSGRMGMRGPGARTSNPPVWADGRRTMRRCRRFEKPSGRVFSLMRVWGLAETVAGRARLRRLPGSPSPKPPPVEGPGKPVPLRPVGIAFRVESVFCLIRAGPRRGRCAPLGKILENAGASRASRPGLDGGEVPFPRASEVESGRAERPVLFPKGAAHHEFLHVACARSEYRNSPLSPS